MSSNKFYPALSEILPIEKIPSTLGPVKGGLQNIFNKIFYRDFLIDKSQFGDTASIRITLLSYNRIGFDIPGTGLSIILNPDDIPSAVTPIGINVIYKWEILKYINGFKSAAFNNDAKAFFDLFIEILDVEYSDLLSEAVSVFVDAKYPISQVQQFVADFNLKYGPVQNLVLSSNTEIDLFGDLINQLDTQGLDIISIIFSDFVNSGNSFDEIFDNIKLLFKKWFGNISITDFKQLLLPSVSLSINNISAGIEFPRNIFVPVITAANNPTGGTIGDPLPDPYKTILKCTIGSVNFSTENGYEFNQEGNFSFPKSYILGTRFTLELNDLKLDLSRTRNIPEAIADGRPDDFIGVYIKNGIVGFPADWNHNPPGSPASTGELYVSNLLAGTGGISGTIGLRAITAGTASPLIRLKFGSGFEVELDTFSMTFQQNAITDSSIKGAMTIPGFKDPSGNPAKIFIDIHIAQNGVFDITASVNQAIPVLTIPQVFAFDVKSLFFGKNADGRFYAGVSGDVDFLLQPPIGKFLPDKIDIKKLIIYDNGKFEIEGGSIHLPKAFELKMGPAKIAITAIHLGSFEKEGRKYKYFGFDGGVNVNPGGVNAMGKGINYYYTVDGPFDNADHKFKWFIRLESLAIDIIIPGSSKPEDAAVIIKGFLSIKDPKILPGTPPAMVEILKNSTEYAGGVYVSIPKFKGLEASASMRLNPKVPAFIVDLGIEISTPILLGTTGLGIYGFRALFGKKYVASKFAADLQDDAEWWQYYKAKIDPDFKEGIQTSKFLIKEGFSFGAGVSP
jgi:hypothetical protein